MIVVTMAKGICNCFSNSLPRNFGNFFPRSFALDYKLSADIGKRIALRKVDKTKCGTIFML